MRSCTSPRAAEQRQHDEFWCHCPKQFREDAEPRRSHYCRTPLFCPRVDQSDPAWREYRAHVPANAGHPSSTKNSRRNERVEQALREGYKRALRMHDFEDF